MRRSNALVVTLLAGALALVPTPAVGSTSPPASASAPVTKSNVDTFVDRFDDVFGLVLDPLVDKLRAVKKSGRRDKIVSFSLNAGGGKVTVEGLGIVLPEPARFELTLDLNGVSQGTGSERLTLNGLLQLDVVPYGPGKALGLFRGSFKLGGLFKGRADVRGEVSGTKVVALEVTVGNDTFNPTRKPKTLLSYVSTVAGDGIEGFRDGAGSQARFDSPTGIAVDRAGTLYVADRDNDAVRKVKPSGATSTLAEGLKDPRDLGVDALGDLLVTEGTYPDVPLARVDTGSGLVTPVVFNEDASGQGYCGLNLPPCDGRSPLGTMTWPAGIDVQGSVAYVFEYAPPWIRIVLPDGLVGTILRGNDGGRHGGTCGSLGVVGAGGADVAKGLDGEIYFVADASGCYGVLVLRGDGTVEALAGKLDEFGNQDGVGNKARFFSPEGLVFDGSRYLYVADTGNNLIRRVDIVTRKVVRVAGCLSHTDGFDCTNTFGFRDGSMDVAQFYAPTGIAQDQWGDLYVVDDRNNAVRMIRVIDDPEEWTPTIDSFRPWAVARGRTTTLEVHGSNLGLAESAGLGAGVTVDIRHAGTRLLYLDVTVAPGAAPGPRTLTITTPYGKAATPPNLSLEILDDSFAGATVETIAGTGTWSPAFQDGPAEQSEIAFPAGMTTVDDDRLLVADPVEQRVRLIATYDGAAQEITELLLYASGATSALGSILASLGLIGQGLEALGIVDQLGSLAESVIREQFVKPSIDQMCQALNSPCEWLSLPWAGKPLDPGLVDGFRLDSKLFFPSDVQRSADGVFFVSDPGNSRIRVVGLNPGGSASADAPFTTFRTDSTFERPLTVGALAKDTAVVGTPADSLVKRLAMQNNGDYSPFVGVEDALRCEQLPEDPSHPMGLPVAIAHAGGTTYVADLLCQTIWRVDDATKEVEDVRGTTRVPGADVGPCSDGPVGLATFGAPVDLDVDAAGNIWFVDAVCNSVRVIKDLAAPDSEVAAQLKDWLDSVGGHLPKSVTQPAYDKIEALDEEYLRTNRFWVLTVAGSQDGEAGFVDGSATDARFFAPIGIAVRQRAGGTSVFVSDAGNHRIRLLQIP